MTSTQDTSFARLVSLAAHDLRTPLATVHGFARTIQRTQELEEPLPRYLEIIVAAAGQMTELLEEVGLVARIEGGRYDAVPVEVDTLEVAQEAVADVDGARAEGAGATVETDRASVTRALTAYASCALRHGPLKEVVVAVDGRELTFSPIAAAGPILVGDELRDLGAAVATRLIRTLGGSVELDGDALRVRL
jgi:two-component system OmpR family sensor kinase